MIQRLLHLRFVGLEEKPRGAVAVPASWLRPSWEEKHRLELLPDRMLANGEAATRPTVIVGADVGAEARAARPSGAETHRISLTPVRDASLPSPWVHEEACSHRHSMRARGAGERGGSRRKRTSGAHGHAWVRPRKGARPARRANVVRVGGGVRLPSLVLFVVGVVLERWDLAGEQTPVLGIPIDGRE